MFVGFVVFPSAPPAPAQAASRLAAQLLTVCLPVRLQVTAGPQRERGGDPGIMAHSVSAFQAAYISIEVLIALVSVPGNILVIWAVKMNQALRDATFCFIVSLAVADVAVGALVIPLAIIINIGPQTEFYSCLMVACPVLILTESSILALLAIAVDRYLRVKIPVRWENTSGLALQWLLGGLKGSEDAPDSGRSSRRKVLPPLCRPRHIWLQQQLGQAGLGVGPRASSSFNGGSGGAGCAGRGCILAPDPHDRDKCVPHGRALAGHFREWKGDDRFVFSPGFPLPWGSWG